MKILSLCITFIGVCLFGSTHSLIIKFESLVDVEHILDDFDVASSDGLPGQPLYRVEIISDLEFEDLASQLYEVPEVVSCEKNQVGIISGPVAAGSIDQRPILIMDQRPILIMDQGQVSSLNESGDILFHQPFLYQINAHPAWQEATGVGILVALIDTGIDMTHPFLENSISANGYDFVADDRDPSEERLDLDSNDNGLLDEGWGHGTHVAGIIKLVAPDVVILPIRVVDSDGQADLFNLLRGLEYAIARRVRIINLSMSIPEPSRLLQEWILKAKKAHMLVVTSAGNDNVGELDFPADEHSVLAVASVDAFNLKSSFSNYGSAVDACAPGENVLSCLPGGNTYVERTGTSMATPMVTGLASLILEQRPNSQFSSLRHRIENNAFDIDSMNPDYNNLLGGGLIDLHNSLFQ